MTDSAGGRPAASGLLRILGAGFGLAIVVGATIGGGILHSPGDVARALPDSGLFMLAWVLGAGNALLGAAAYAELGAMVPRSGGVYPFVHRAFGDTAGLLTGCIDWINWTVSAAGLVLLVGEYSAGIIPALSGHAMLAGFLALLVLALLQWRGVETGGQVQELTSAIKALALIGLIAAAFILPHAAASPATTTAPVTVPHGVGLLFAFGIAMQSVVFTYDSYYIVVYCGGEVRDPGRVIPRAIFQGLWLIIGIYLLLNVAFLVLIPVTRMAGDPFVGGTMAAMLFGRHGDAVIRIIMIVSVLGTANAQILAAPRILHAMARDGLAPRRLAHVNRGGTPTVALALSLALTCGFLVTGSFTVAIDIDSVFILVLYIATFASLFQLRRTEPATPRPYRAWGYPLVPALALLSSAALLVAFALGDHRSTLIAAVLLLAAWPLSLLARRVLRLGTASSA